MANEEFDSFVGGLIDDPEQRTEIINRKVTPIFFLIDVSGSMKGSKIDTVNNTMADIMRDLNDMNNSPDFDLRFAVLSFGTDCEWVTGDNQLHECDGEWMDLEAEGLTYFNTACRELKDKLSGKKFFKFAAGKTITPPVIILLTDGFANDGDKDGYDGVEALKQNKYFKGSHKLAIAIGDSANQTLCENFAGDTECVFTAYNEKALRKILNAVIKASVVVSSSGTSSLTSEQSDQAEPDMVKPNSEELIQAINDEIQSVDIPSNMEWD